MFKEYLKDVLGRLSSTRLQSIHTHIFTLSVVAIMVITYIVLIIVHSCKVGKVELIEVPDNVTNLIMFLITILLTYASAPKSFAQRIEMKTYKETFKDDNTKEPLSKNSAV